MASIFPFLKRFSAILWISTLFLLTACIAENSKKSNSDESTTENARKKNLDSRQENTASTPKNIIIFIGDGMGISTLTAGRIFVGQQKGQTGEEYELSWDRFEQLALIKTYNTNAQVPDSAGTATAILSGYKTNIGAINVRPDKNLQNMLAEGCGGPAPLTLTAKAKRDGKAVGVVSTARLTHATPAAMYGHAASRSIESDKDLKPPFDYEGCKSLSQQLLDSDVDIALGGGLQEFDPKYLSSNLKENVRGHYRDAQALRKIDQNDIRPIQRGEKILGLFSDSHMSYEADRDDKLEPSIAEMTTFSMDHLSDNEDGYVLMVEAGRIDHAHHGANAYRALKDLEAFDTAVAAAVAKASDDTLILVTADHSHVFTMAGYPVRGNPILGLTRGIDNRTGKVAADYSLDQDGKPYTTLGYQNGPNVRAADSAPLTDNLVQARDYKQQSAVNLRSETHAGEDVALFATGPGADRFNGVMEQDEIGKILEDFLTD